MLMNLYKRDYSQQNFYVLFTKFLELLVHWSLYENYLLIQGLSRVWSRALYKSDLKWLYCLLNHSKFKLENWFWRHTNFFRILLNMTLNCWALFKISTVLAMMKIFKWIWIFWKYSHIFCLKYSYSIRELTFMLICHVHF